MARERRLLVDMPDSTPRNEGLSSTDLANMLASIGTRRKRRPYDPITVAEKIAESGLTDAQWATRMSVTPQTIRMFRNLLSLPTTVQQFVREGAIGRDQGDRLSRLRSPADQAFLAQAIVAKRASPDVVKEVVALKNRSPGTLIETALQMTLDSKPILEDRHVVVTRLTDRIWESVMMESKRASSAIPDIVVDAIRKAIDAQFVEVSSPSPGFLLVGFDNSSWRRFEAWIKMTQTPIADAVSRLLQSQGIGDQAQ